MCIKAVLHNALYGLEDRKENGSLYIGPIHHTAPTTDTTSNTKLSHYPVWTTPYNASQTVTYLLNYENVYLLSNYNIV